MNSNQIRLVERLSLISLFLIVVLLPLYGINFINGSGRDVSTSSNQVRDRDFFYHNGTDDQHWYGAPKWAVRFDFAAAYATFENSQFTTNKVKIFFPVVQTPANMVTLELFSDEFNLPDSSLVVITDSITTNWKEFNLPVPITRNAVWVVVTSDTAVNGPYISSSIGGGQHSYYWNTNAPTAYYQNMDAVGYHSEFLFSVVGNFVLNDVDIELNSFQLKPQITPNSIVRPEFTIYNNSSSIVNDASIVLTITSPNPDLAVQDTIQIARSILPHSEVTVPYTDSDYLDYQYPLPANPCQFKMVAVLHSEHDAVDTLFNNTVTRYYNCFNDDLPIRVVENFIKTNNSENFLNAQDSLNTEDIRNINFCPMVSDPNYSVGAVQRYNWYDFSGMPMTVIGGDDLITGFQSLTYNGLYLSSLNELNAQKTFLSESSHSFNFPSPYNLLQVRLALRNPSTYLFSEPAITSQARFYAALCKKDSLYSAERLFFKKWGAYADTLLTTYPMGEASLKQFAVPVSDLPVDSLNANYVIVYWIQNQSTKEILFSNLISLEDVVSTTDAVTTVAPLSLSLSPNPVKLGNEIKIMLTDGYSKSKIKYSIYNTKGQLVKSRVLAHNQSRILVTKDIRTAGVYLIRFNLTDNQNRPASLTKKIFVY
jgi:hypothetical protein